MLVRLSAFLLLIFLAGFAYAAQPLRCPEGPSHLIVEKGEYSSRPGVVFALENFSATILPRGKRLPLCQAKVTDIERGTVSVTTASLTELFNERMRQSKQQQSISDVKISASGEHIVISGKAHKGVGIPFTIEGPVDVYQGTAILLRAEKIKAGALPMKGLLGLVGAKLSSLMNPQATEGVEVQGNSVIFHPEMLAEVRGHLTSVQVQGDHLVVQFGPAPRAVQTAHANTKPR